MADQMESHDREHHRYQSPHAAPQNHQASSLNPQAAQHFVAPSESFGPFGPLPGYSTDAPFHDLPPTDISSAPGTPEAAPAHPFAPVQPAAPDPGVPPPGGQAHSFSGTGSFHSTPRKTKQPLRFPLTRHAPASLQTFGMLFYSLVMAISIMICALMLLRAYIMNTSVYLTMNNSVNGLSIFVTAVILLVLVPACSLFCGVFFGSWRGLIVSLCSIVGGLLIAHLTDYRLGTPNATYQNYLLYSSLPITALIVGFIYERRKFAAWWKSMFTMFLGMAIPVFSLATLFYSLTATSSNLNILVADAHTTAQTYLAALAISFGCFSLLFILLLGLLYAGVEGIIHSILARAARK